MRGALVVMATQLQTGDIASALNSLASQECLVLPADGPDRPDFLLLDRHHGLLAIEVDASGADPRDRQPFVRLNRKLAELEANVALPEGLFPRRVVVLGGLGTARAHPSVPGQVVLGREDIESPAWFQNLPYDPIEPKVIEQLRGVLAPELQFVSRARAVPKDEGASAREDLRIQLDASQAAVATRAVRDTLMLTGPPGSGKSLVLAARARWLVRCHPDWTIQMLCYNNALVPYLRGLVDEHPNVRVSTFGKYCAGLGIRFSFDRDEVTFAGLASAKQRGLRPTIDAVLIDEAQDFRSSWLQVIFATLRPGKGGAVLAGDPAQALYDDHDHAHVLASRQVETVQLTRPYRSTRQILRVTESLDPSFSVMGADSAPDGEPVDLVWAASWDEQARCIAWEVKSMLADQHRIAEDVGVLVTQRGGALRRLRTALEQEGLPFLVIDRTNADTFDPRDPSVKVITVHSAKGHEFPVVILMGLEALPDPTAADPVSIRRGRVGYVGATRAKDQLIITYTRDNRFLKRLEGIRDGLRRWVWPDDYPT